MAKKKAQIENRRTIVDCPNCDSKVEAEQKGQVDLDLEMTGAPAKIVLAECRICHNPIVGYSEVIQLGQNEWDWSDLDRLWPAPETDLDSEIPDIARISLVEAQTCFRAKAFTACAVMCGRAIEGVCKHHNAKTKTLADGLKDLKQKGVIDGRLLEWGEALRAARNLGAHASTEKVSRADARDLLDFSRAICDYVFVLHAKFERFKERQSK
jgi:hypothetical protein